MAKYNIDTNKLEEASLEIKSITSNINRVLTEYVSMMAKVPTETKEWQGNASEEFVEIIKNDFRNEYLPLLDNIIKYADEMSLESTEFQNIPSNNTL
ncbi:MAG TPA: hypothetical protein IAC02_07920 [Candidatus Coprovivens excrementavium]|nr:hypothetical protein [Candidatus Coprovivens excrementavium]